MKKVFLDTDVVIDFLTDRVPFSVDAAILFSLAQEGKVNLFISAVSYNNIYYILRQSYSNQRTLELLEEVSDMVEIVDVTGAIIKRSLKTSFFKDFEDAIQYNAALTIKGLNCIVTRNAKDYKKSVLPIMSAAEAVALF